MIIAIDGPAGSGKTTIAKKVAKELNIFYLDTGATYRALTWKLIKDKIDISNEQEVALIAKKLNLRFIEDKIYVDDYDVTWEIRTPLIDTTISKPVSFPLVREQMVVLQRRLASQRDVVVEGRDTTTVVFPDAEFKFFLDASLEERVKRRMKDFLKRGIKITEKELKEQIEKRDHADRSRKVGALRISPEATYIDTTNLTIDEVVKKIVSLVK